MALVYEFATRFCGNLFVATQVDVDFGARTTRTCVAHLPEIVVAVAVDDMVGGEELFPIACSFIVALETFGGITLEHCGIEA